MQKEHARPSVSKVDVHFALLSWLLVIVAMTEGKPPQAVPMKRVTKVLMSLLRGQCKVEAFLIVLHVLLDVAEICMQKLLDLWCEPMDRFIGGG
jgi:hypothetical protein